MKERIVCRHALSLGRLNQPVVAADKDCAQTLLCQRRVEIKRKRKLNSIVTFESMRLGQFAGCIGKRCCHTQELKLATDVVEKRGIHVVAHACADLLGARHASRANAAGTSARLMSAM
jgi:hypothetical protein